jgi:hypothetical protein
MFSTQRKITTTYCRSAGRTVGSIQDAYQRRKSEIVIEPQRQLPHNSCHESKGDDNSWKHNEENSKPHYGRTSIVTYMRLLKGDLLWSDSRHLERYLRMVKSGEQRVDCLHLTSRRSGVSRKLSCEGFISVGGAVALCPHLQLEDGLSMVITNSQGVSMVVSQTVAE